MKKLILLTILMAFIPTAKVFAMADSAFGACIMNAATGEVVWEKNGHEKHSMASTTKIMTAIVAMENVGMDTPVTVSEAAAGTEGSSMYIQGGDVFSMRDMLYGLMLNSGNDAAEAIAENVAGSREAFAAMMNQKAYDIGALNTQFQNPSGLDADGHYTTAYDLALITKYGLQNKDFCDIMATKYIEVNEQNTGRMIPLSNHNKLLGSYEGCIGGKTGFTQKTGRCLVSIAERDGMKFIVTTINDQQDWEDHKEMLDYCFHNHRPFRVIKRADVVNHIVSGSEKCNLVYAADFTIPLRLDEAESVEVQNHVLPSFYGGINQWEKLGEARVMCDGVCIGTVDIVADNPVSSSEAFRMRRSFWLELETMVKNFLL